MGEMASSSRSVDLRAARARARWAVAAAVVAVALASGTDVACAASRADGILVRFRDDVSPGAADRVHAALHAHVGRRFATMRNLHLVTPPAGVRVEDVLAAYRRDPSVRYAEPNSRVRAMLVPDDPEFPYLWNMSIIDAPGAWDLTTGSDDVVVAVPDSGIYYDHPDLAANVFRNEADCNADGIDDDQNGFVDDCHGINPVAGTSDPLDDNGHGTTVSGIIGAVGNNGIGVVGVAWHVKILACKMIGADGTGTLADALECLDYIAMMRTRGVNIVAANASWATSEFSQALLDAVQGLEQAGILFVAAAGNSGTDTASCPVYPGAFATPDLVTVTATNESDVFPGWPNFGAGTVHLAAPGDTRIESTDLPAKGYYHAYIGTSLSAPHVTGAAALLKAQNPPLDWIAMKNLLIAGGDVLPTLLDKTISGRRLNAYGALTCQDSEVVARLRPTPLPPATVGVPFHASLSVLHVNCAAPAGDVTAVRQPGNEHITLHDDGAGSDRVAGDGIYTADWTATLQQTSTLTYPDGDVETVHVWPDLPNLVASPAPAVEESFGTALAMSDTNLFVGAPGDAGVPRAFCHFGAVYVFDRATRALVRTFVTPVQDTNDGPMLIAGAFGASIAVDGGRLLVGAPYGPSACFNCQFGQALLYDVATGDLLHALAFPESPLARAFDHVGASVAMAGDTIVVGAPRSTADETLMGDLVGAALLFDAATGAYLATLRSPAADPLLFGQLVATNGTRVAVGELGGRVYVFDSDRTSATFGQLLFTYDGTDYGATNFGVAFTFVGDALVVGAPDTWNVGGNRRLGAVYVFDGPTLVRTWFNPYTIDEEPGPGTRFGASLAPLGQGGVVVGAPNANVGGRGLAYVFDLTSSTPSKSIRAAANATGFGTVVTGGDDAIVVGAPTAFESAGYGAAFLFSPTLDFPPDPQFTLVPTKSFKMRDDTQPPISASRRLVRWKSFTSASSTSRIVPPAPGSTGDPTLAGAVLTVYNAAGLTLDSVTLPLAATGTSPGDGWSRAGATGYLYKSRDPLGPISRILVKPGKIVLRGGKASWGYRLDDPAQGVVAVRLQLGDAPTWCAAIPPRSPERDRVDLFDGAPNAPAPSACPTLP